MRVSVKRTTDPLPGSLPPLSAPQRCPIHSLNLRQGRRAMQRDELSLFPVFIQGACCSRCCSCWCCRYRCCCFRCRCRAPLYLPLSFYLSSVVPFRALLEEITTTHCFFLLFCLRQQYAITRNHPITSSTVDPGSNIPNAVYCGFPYS